MAKLKAPAASGPMIRENAPEGNCIATCIANIDQFEVTKQKYQSDEFETIDQTKFYFGIKGKDGKNYMVGTFWFKLSTDDRSNLSKFLRDWLGTVPIDTDTGDLVGTGAQIRIKHRESKGKMYANIDSIAPVMDELADKVLPVSAFADVLSTDEAIADNDSDSDAPF